MVQGLRAKNREGIPVPVNYLVHIREVKPWPPSQSVGSPRAVLIQWENGDRSTGSTNSVVPSLGSVVGEGKIEFNESFRVPVTFLRDMSVKSRDGEVFQFQKNCLEFHLYEPRRDKTVKGQLLANAVIDLSEYGVLKEALSIMTPMYCKRSYRNTEHPLLYITLQSLDKTRTNSLSRESLSRVMSMDHSEDQSVSTLMDEEYAEESENASFTDDEGSSHSSVAASSNGGSHHRHDENGTNAAGAEGLNGKLSSKLQLAKETLEHRNETSDSINRSSSKSSSLDLSSSDLGSPQNSKDLVSRSADSSSGNVHISGEAHGVNNDKSLAELNNAYANGGRGKITDRVKEFEKLSLNGDTSEKDDERNKDIKQNFAEKTQKCEENRATNERLKHVKSVRAETVRSGLAKESDNQGDAQNTNLMPVERKEAFPRDTRSAVLERKMHLLETRIKTLEGELIEAAAIEASLYSVVAEHGSSMSKVHAPARRLSRLYLHACKENSVSRMASVARSAVSGLVLVAKACGNDVPRLTFWLSNSVVLRTIISQAYRKSNTLLPVNEKISSSLKWKFSPSKREGMDFVQSMSSDWEDPLVYTNTLEKIEAWIFSRIVESIWWQTLTPHMQTIDATETDKDIGSLDLWKKAFGDSFERLCPVRAGGHECGCLPMLPRLVMEQCVSRLDVAMFNAILRESGDEIPTDPVSDPISDSRVLPIPSGESSFGAGAQLKTAIGNWSRWLTDIFGTDKEVSLQEMNSDNSDDERRETSFKLFHLLNAMSDLMMLPKDMLLSKSIRKEVCPTFGAPLIKRVLDTFSPDEFCSDPIPDSVLEALESEDSNEAEEGTIDFPCSAAAIVYSPPSASAIASVVGEVGGKAHLKRCGSSVLKKAYTSDDELDELNSPLALILNDGSRSSPVSTRKSGWISKEKTDKSAVRYELLRDVWMESE